MFMFINKFLKDVQAAHACDLRKSRGVHVTGIKHANAWLPPHLMKQRLMLWMSPLVAMGNMKQWLRFAGTSMELILVSNRL